MKDNVKARLIIKVNVDQEGYILMCKVKLHAMKHEDHICVNEFDIVNTIILF